METYVADPRNTRRAGGVSSPLPAVLSLFLPTTSPLTGGMVLRVRPRQPAELLVPNPFGAGILVADACKLDDLGFVPTAFDRVLIRQIIALREPAPADVRKSFFSVASTGFAGRETQVMARLAIETTEVRKATLRRDIRALTKEVGVSLEWAEWLASRLLFLGVHSESCRRGDGGAAFTSPVPARLRIVKEALELLPQRRHALERAGLNTDRVVKVATEAFGRIEALYAMCAGLLAQPKSLLRIPAETRTIDQELATLDGWIRFALLLREIPAAPAAGFMLAEFFSLAHVLTHHEKAAAGPSVLGNAMKPSQAHWPAEVDQALYFAERNERLSRTLLLCDARED
ncbi:hypothetical protein [Acetobacter conturbans]|uniref:RepB plasmid partition domain-containing protein n=1 Tax=Acetobacter conturbans TaxID=1737472 RepID=A0ABX0JZL5_9PROT|nr:hypothetical protein [Acetobacter conturbans]NHN87996.1 hypothetical protein [Acetobacter conturbans]